MAVPPADSAPRRAQSPALAAFTHLHRSVVITQLRSAFGSISAGAVLSAALGVEPVAVLSEGVVAGCAVVDESGMALGVWG
jgi:hypothetical protein